MPHGTAHPATGFNNEHDECQEDEDGLAVGSNRQKVNAEREQCQRCIKRCYRPTRQRA